MWTLTTWRDHSPQCLRHETDLTDPEWVTDGQNYIADLNLAAVGQGQRRQIVCIDLNECNVGLRVAANNLRRELAAIIQDHLDLTRVIYDVTICEDIAIRRNDYP